MGDLNPEALTRRVSVVIPTYNRCELVVNCVRALCAQSEVRADEIIVVVDGSDDNTVPALAALDGVANLRVVERLRCGAATARTTGANVASGDVIVFLDDDMEAAPDLIAQHLRSHARGAQVVYGDLPLHPDSPHTFLSERVGIWAAERLQRLTAAADEAHPLNDFQTGQMSIRREVFHFLGGFDSEFTKGGTYGNEDLDLGYRARLAGFKIEFNPLAVSYQRYVVDPRSYLRQRRGTGEADARFAQKHPEDPPRPLPCPHGLRRILWPLVCRFVSLGTLADRIVGPIREQIIVSASRELASARAIRLFDHLNQFEYLRGVAEGADQRLYLCSGCRRAVRILAYHAVNSCTDAPVIGPYVVSPAQFRRQISLLRRLGAHFIEPVDLLGYLHGVTPLPRRAVLLTFDDGYADLLSVLPFLDARQIAAMVFPVSGSLGGLNFWDQAIGAPALRRLDAEGLRELLKHSWVIGSHSCSHRSLPSLSATELSSELHDSRSDLSGATGLPPVFFAYPSGAYDERVMTAASRAGYEACFTVDPGIARPGLDLRAIPRVEVRSTDTTMRFLLKVLTGGGDGGWLRARARQVRFRAIRAQRPSPIRTTTVPGSVT